jgi:hypothetical protein
MESLTVKCILQLLTGEREEELLNIFKDKHVWVSMLQHRSNKIPIILDYSVTLTDAVESCLSNIGWSFNSQGDCVYELTDGEIYDFIYYDDVKRSLEVLKAFENMFGDKWMICKCNERKLNTLSLRNRNQNKKIVL